MFLCTRGVASIQMVDQTNDQLGFDGQIQAPLEILSAFLDGRILLTELRAAGVSFELSPIVAGFVAGLTQLASERREWDGM